MRPCEFVLAQVARRTAELSRKQTPEPTPMDIDLAEYEEEWDEEATACFWTTPAGKWAFVPGRKGKGKGQAQSGKGKKGKGSAAEKRHKHGVDDDLLALRQTGAP